MEFRVEYELPIHGKTETLGTALSFLFERMLT
jgi:hypothetical protein